MRYAILPDEDWTRVELTGDIDENAGEVLRKIRSRIDTRGVIFHAGGVQHVSSSGIAAWIAGMADFADLETVFVDCSFSMVRAAQASSEFLPGLIASFQIPYFCDTCDAEDPQVHVNRREEAELLGGLKMVSCSHCGNLMEPDEPELVDLFRLPLPRGA